MAAIQAEHYWLTGGRDVQWPSMSVAKSFIYGLWSGIAVQEGFIKSVEDPMDRYVPSLSGSVYEGVAHKKTPCRCHPVALDRGLQRSKLGNLPFDSSYGSMRSLDAFVQNMVRESEPGTVCRYNSAETQALGMASGGGDGTVQFRTTA